MRMYENFSGCRILSYCFMSNHFHILLEVTPMAADGLSDEELLKRLHAIHHEGYVERVAWELAEVRERIQRGVADSSLVEAIHARFTYRMHDLSQFMKGFMQRYTQWHNRTNDRRGHLWEDRFKSVIVEDGVACKAMAAYIDLNPVRAGIVKEPADYRWSSYGEAIGGGAKGNGKKARAGLVRAMRAHKGVTADAELWAHNVSREYRNILLGVSAKRLDTQVGRNEQTEAKRTRHSMSAEEVKLEQARDERRMVGILFGKMLRCRVRYFTDGAVIGSRNFVNEVFAGARERFGSRRKDGARKLRGNGAAAAGMLWSMRNLHKDIG